MDEIAEVPVGKPDQLQISPEQKVNYGNTYRFRHLVNSERQMLERSRIDPEQPELSRQLLAKPEFAPTGVLQIDDKEFLVGKVIHTRDRDQAIMYVRDVTGRLLPRVFYKSKSDGGWRSCPGAIGGWYSKGQGFHYTQETKPHENIIRYLEEASAVGHIAGFHGDVIEQYFDYTRTTGRPEWYTFDLEIKRYDDNGVLRQFQQYEPGQYTHKKLGHNPNLSAKFQTFDFSRPELRGFVPDFAAGPVKTSRVKHTLLGYVSMENYTAQLNGRPIEWVMAHDSKGRVWVERIAFTDTQVSSYGISPEVIDSGALTNKPVEYRSQINALTPGKEYEEFGGSYVDITPLLDNLAPIQVFRQTRGITTERIPGRGQPLALEVAKDFNELATALTKLAGLQGANHYYTAPELLDIVNKVRAGEVPPEYLTRTGGLRDAVMKLMAKGQNGTVQRQIPEIRRPVNITEARSFDQLYDSLDRLGGLQGHREYYTADQLKDLIDKLRRGILPIGYITRTDGLRETVIRLLRPPGY